MRKSEYFGGSFNPIRHGHLISWRRTSDRRRGWIRCSSCRLMRLLLSSTERSLPGEDRFRMVRLAVRRHRSPRSFRFRIGRRPDFLYCGYRANGWRKFTRRMSSFFITRGGFRSGDRTLEGLRRSSFAAIRFSWEDAPGYRDAELAEFAEYLCREYQADVRIDRCPESGYFLYPRSGGGAERIRGLKSLTG